MLAEKLLLSLEVEEYPPQEEVARHWLEVVKQRAAELESGAVQLIPGEDVLRETGRKSDETMGLSPRRQSGIQRDRPLV